MTNHKKSHCRHLRTKMTYIPDFADDDRWRTGESMTQQYWCLCTMSTAGPDDDFVAPEKCHSDRVCFKSVEIVT